MARAGLITRVLLLRRFSVPLAYRINITIHLAPESMGPRGSTQWRNHLTVYFMVTPVTRTRATRVAASLAALRRTSACLEQVAGMMLLLRVFSHSAVVHFAVQVSN